MKRTFWWNSILNSIAFVADLALKFLLLRLALHRLGAELFAILGILRVATTLPLFLIEGLSFAVFVRASRDPHPSEGAGEAVSVSALFGLLVGLLMVLLAPSLAAFFRIPPNHTNAAVLAFRLSGFTFFFTSVGYVLLHLLQGAGRFDLATAARVSFSLINSLLAIRLLQQGYQIVALTALELGINAILVAVCIFLCSKTFRERLLPRFRLGRLRELWKETTGQILFSTAGKILWELDAVIIPRFFGIATMASYWIAQRIPYTWMNVVWVGNWPAVPATAGDSDSQSRLEKIHWLQICLLLPVAAYLWTFAHEIILIWMGSDTGNAPRWMRFLIVACTIDLIAVTFISFLFGQGKVLRVNRILIPAVVLKILLAACAVFLRNLEFLLISTIAGAVVSTVGLYRVIWKETAVSLLRSLTPVFLSAVACAGSIFTIFLIPSPASLLELILHAGIFAVFNFLMTLLLLRLFSLRNYLDLRNFLLARKVNRPDAMTPRDDIIAR